MTGTIALASSKGGTGKTTTALNLAVALAEKERRTILVDLDPQGAIALALCQSDTEWAGLTEYLMEGGSLEEFILKTKLPALSILPRGRIDPVDICEYESFLRSSQKLGEIVEQLKEHFDYVILDTPSGLGMVTRAAFAASDFVLIPLQAEPLALRSIGQILRVVEYVQNEENPGLKLLGIVPTMVQLNQDASLNVMATAWSEFGGVLDTCIPRAEVFGAASELGLPVGFLGGRTPPEARRFTMLAEEIEAIISDLSGTAGDNHEKTARALI